MALDNFNAAVALLNDAADRLIAKAAADAASLGQAQSDVAGADNAATAAIQPIIDKLTSAAPTS